MLHMLLDFFFPRHPSLAVVFYAMKLLLGSSDTNICMHGFSIVTTVLVVNLTSFGNLCTLFILFIHGAVHRYGKCGGHCTMACKTPVWKCLRT